MSEFETMPGTDAGGDRGEPSRTSRSIAAAAAAAAVDNIPEAPITYTNPEHSRLRTHEEMNLERVLADELAGNNPAVVVPVVAPPAAVAPVRQGRTFTQEDYESLQELGIQLLVSPNEVPEGFQDIYGEMAQQFIDVHHTTQEAQLNAQVALLKVKDFTDSLGTSEGQRRMLLGMALNNPEVFNGAMETVSRMSEDPEYGEGIRRTLEADVKLETAIRKERAMAHASNQRKGAQVEARTTRLAARLGVDAQLAKDMVAHRILQNKARTGTADITFQEVDQVLGALAERTGSRIPVAVKSPETVLQEARAPQVRNLTIQTPPSPVAVPYTNRTPMGEGLEHPLDRLRGAVKSASSNVRSQGF